MNEPLLNENPWVVRTDFDDDSAWEVICDLIRAPVRSIAGDFCAYVAFVDSVEYKDLSKEEVLARLPDNYNHTFLFIVDRTTTSHSEFPILVVDLYHERGREFRAGVPLP